MKKDYERARKVRALQNKLDTHRSQIQKSRTVMATTRAEIKTLRKR